VGGPQGGRRGGLVKRLRPPLVGGFSTLSRKDRVPSQLAAPSSPLSSPTTEIYADPAPDPQREAKWVDAVFEAHEDKSASDDEEGLDPQDEDPCD
jgi:hypothetical protein